MRVLNWLKVVFRVRALLLMIFCAGSVYAFNLNVKVVDCNGTSTGMGGVRIKVFRVYGNGSTELDRNLKTDASGNLNMQGFSQGTYEIQVFCPKGTAAIRHEFYPGPFVSTAHYVFKCCPTGTSGIVSGTFYYDSGQVETTIYDEAGNKVKVSMTDDQYEGGTFSGTVLTEAAGNTAEERAVNEGELSGRVVSVESSSVPVRSGALTWNIPVAIARNAVEIILRDRSGKVVGSAKVPHGPKPVQTRPPTTPAQAAFKLPTIGQAGSVLKAEGPFNGKFDNTSITIGGQEVEKIAESPNQIVFKPRNSPSGRSEIVLREGKYEARAPYRNVTAKLSAPTTTINTGQNLNVQAEFTGLEGVIEDVMVVIQVLGPVKLKGGNFQTIKVSPKQVHDGKYELTLPLVGERPGGFTVKATVVTKGSERAVMSGPNVYFRPDEPEDPCAKIRKELEELRNELAAKGQKEYESFEEWLKDSYKGLGGALTKTETLETASKKLEDSRNRPRTESVAVIHLQLRILVLKKQLEDCEQKKAIEAEKAAKEAEAARLAAARAAEAAVRRQQQQPPAIPAPPIIRGCPPPPPNAITYWVVFDAASGGMGSNPPDNGNLGAAKMQAAEVSPGGTALDKMFNDFIGNPRRRVWIKFVRVTEGYVCKPPDWVLSGATTSIPSTATGWIELPGPDQIPWSSGNTDTDLAVAIRNARNANGFPGRP